MVTKQKKIQRAGGVRGNKQGKHLENTRPYAIPRFDYRKDYDHAHMILKNLWLGNMQAAKDIDFIKSNNIRFILNCTKDIPNFFQDSNVGIRYFRIPVDDSLMKKDFIIMTDYLFNVVPLLSRLLSNNVTVLVHCYAGMQRSACVVAALLVRNKVPLQQAVSYIKNKRKVAFTPQINFIDSLLLYALNNQ
jgi:hypothetical protein